MYKRIYDNIYEFLEKNKVLAIYGPRRVGKTTLINQFLKNSQLKYKFDNGDNIKIQEILSSNDFNRIKEYAEGYELIVIDEAQNIQNIGMGLKIIADQISEIMVIATGSSSFDLKSRIGEPLTGRKISLILFPISQLELNQTLNKFDLKQRLEDYLIFGSYPEVLMTDHKEKKIDILNELVESYLYKDILALERIKGARVISNLVKLLAFQIGNEVSFNELSENLGIDVKTVQRYIDLLEKSFVIYSLGSLSRNLRKEVKTKNKYYFYDNGVRNAVISQFNSFDLRNDIGQLWENFFIIERRKMRSYKKIYGNSYFWRMYGGDEIDLIEERDGKYFCFECKWNLKKEKLPPRVWSENYTDYEYNVIHKNNYLDFIL